MSLERLLSDDQTTLSLPRWLDRGIVVAVVLACGVALSINIVDPDLWGHVQYGRDALQHGLPITTTYSYLAEGYPWINHEILAEYALAIGNDWFGGAGLLAFKCVLGMALVSWMLYRAFQQGVSLIPACASVLLAAVCLGPQWLLRPQMFSYTLFVLFLATLSYCFAGWEGKWQLSLEWFNRFPRFRALRGWQPQDFEPLEYSIDRLRMLWIVPLILIVWTNTHGAFLAGLCIYLTYLGLRTCEAYSHRGREADGLAKRFALMAGAAILATLLNPYGFRFQLWLVDDLIVPRPEIVEWRSPNFFEFQTVPFLIVLVAWVSCLVLSRKSVDFTQQVILGLIVWQALLHQRHIAFVAIAFGWWMPIHVQSVFERFGIGQRFQSDEERLFGWAPPEDQSFTASLPLRVQQILAVVLMFAIGVGGGQLVYRFGGLKVERSQYPADAFYFIGQQGLTGRMVCTFNWAQYALAAFGPKQPGEPGILVQIDGRCRTSYSQEMLDMHFDFLLGRDDPNLRYRDPASGPLDPARSLHAGRPDLVLISRKQKPSVRVMEENTDTWTLLYQDELAQLWGRKSKYDDPHSAYYLDPKHRVVGNFAPRGYVAWPALPEYRPLRPEDLAARAANASSASETP
jgi:hypothetical protein